MSSEKSLKLAYFGPRGVDWDIARPEDLSPEAVVVIDFKHAFAVRSGPPNDESLAGHPLAYLGLTPYEAFRVEASPWIRDLVERNAVHDRHDPSQFAKFSHFLFAFHDSTFECIAASFSVATRQSHDGQISNVLFDEPT